MIEPKGIPTEIRHRPRELPINLISILQDIICKPNHP